MLFRISMLCFVIIENFRLMYSFKNKLYVVKWFVSFNNIFIPILKNNGPSCYNMVTIKRYI